MNYNDALDKLYGLQKFGIKLGLHNIEKLLDYLGNPHHKLKTFHVAGSNGKGSTSSFLCSILMEAGFRTGLYTSPHFVRFNERIRLNGEEISDDYIVDFISSISNFIDENKPTFFEVTTALALKYFNDSGAEYAVIETGLGGRLDATNAIIPLASVITSISLEHTDVLGHTIEMIAGEKGGIIKKKTKVFTGRLPFDAENVLINISNSLRARLFRLKDNIEEIEGTVSFVSPSFTFRNIQTPLNGYFQKYNAALSILVLTEVLGLNDSSVIAAGLQNVVRNSGIQGRYEIYSEKPVLIFDSAHNLEGIGVFLDTFKRESSGYKKRILLFGAMRDKAVDLMIKKLAPEFDEIHFCTMEYSRAATLSELSSLADKSGIKHQLEENGAEYVTRYLKEERFGECLVVLGSMYILGEIKKELVTKKKLDIFSQ